MEHPPFSFFKNNNFRKITFRVPIAMVGLPPTKAGNGRPPGLITRQWSLLVGRERTWEAKKQEEKLIFLKINGEREANVYRKSR